MMYFHGLVKDKSLSVKRVELYEESSKKNPIRIVTLFGKQVNATIDESSRYCNAGMRRNALNPLMKGIDLWIPANHSIVPLLNQSFISCEPGLLDLNKTPVDEPVLNRHHCFLQDLNCPYTEETEMSYDKSGVDDDLTPLCYPQSQDDVHEKDCRASPASYTSCCTAENNLRTELGSSSLETHLHKRAYANEEDQFIEMAAESLVHISLASLKRSHDFALKPGSRFNSSFQDQGFQDKPEIGDEEPCCSCDSFELHTIGISENKGEEGFWVSSKAVEEVDKTRDKKKEFGVKVKRGMRRMKNFQKEVLPGISSLSRKDILEDINILEAVLRSKEYRKTQEMSGDGKCLKSTQRNVARRRRRRRSE